MLSATDDYRDCAHCKGTGACATGEGGASCLACDTASEVPNPDGKRTGLPCRVCHGTGVTAPMTVKIDRYLRPFITIVLPLALLVLVGAVAIYKDSLLDRVIMFSSPLIATIVAFYFSGKAAKR